MDATTIRRAARVALLTFTMPLPEFTPAALAQSDVSRLDALRDAVQTEVRYVEGEEFVGDRTLLAALESEVLQDAHAGPGIDRPGYAARTGAAPTYRRTIASAWFIARPMAWSMS